MVALIIIIVILLLFVIFGIVTCSLFKFTFFPDKEREACLHDIDSKVNHALQPHRAKISEGFAYIDSREHFGEDITSFDGLRLHAEYYPVKNAKTEMILFHGYRSSGKRDFSCAVEFYNKLGMNVLLVDQRSHGKSEGNLITYGMLERYDCLEWARFVAKKYPDRRIFIEGLSMGATTVLCASCLDLPHNVMGIIADCGFTSPAEIIQCVCKARYGFSGRLFIKIFSVICSVIYKFDLYATSTVESVQNSKVPLLFIHGEADTFVPCYMSRRAYEAAREPKDIITVPGAGHGFSFIIDEKAVSKKIAEFVILCVRPKK